MNINHLPRISSAWTYTAFLIALASAPLVSARAGTASGEQARYQQERAVCIDGRSNQDRATCLKEAEAAHALDRQGKLADPSKDFAGDARERCKVMTRAEQKRDCIARVDGHGTTTGSVAAGGTLTEHVTQVPASAAPRSDSQ
jgi:hypothetical protein